MIKKKYPANWNAKLESWKPPTSWTRASHFVDRWHFWQKCQIRFFPHPLNGWHDRTYHWTFVGECGMGDFTDLVCTYWKDFFPTYNGVSLFFSIVRHERYFFQSRIFFSQESISMLFFLSKSVCRTFFLKSPITPSKVNWSAPKIHQTFGQLTDSDLSIIFKGFWNNRGQNSQGGKGGIRFYLPLPGKSVRSYVRMDVRWRHNQIFSDR